jgi:hypothetical protein
VFLCGSLAFSSSVSSVFSVVRIFSPWPGNTRTTEGLNQGRLSFKPQPSFLCDLGAWPLHLSPFAPFVPWW